MENQSVNVQETPNAVRYMQIEKEDDLKVTLTMDDCNSLLTLIISCNRKRETKPKDKFL